MTTTISSRSRFSAALGHGTVEGSITPVTTGANQVTLTLRDHHGQPITPQSDPRLRLSLPERELGPFEFIAVPGTEPGTFTADVNFLPPGQWTISIVVRVSTFEEPIAQVTVEVP